MIHTSLAPATKVAQTINEKLANAANFCTHWITNAVAEGINSEIMAAKRPVGGYRNRED